MNAAPRCFGSSTIRPADMKLKLRGEFGTSEIRQMEGFEIGPPKADKELNVLRIPYLLIVVQKIARVASQQ